jgi:Holliday junction resolvase RusA-like endonuclease
MSLPDYADAPFHLSPDVVIVLPMPPSANHLFPGRGRRYRSAAYEAWIKEAGFQLIAQRPRHVPGRVVLTIEIGEPKTGRHTDLANREKALIDLLVSHGIIQGDSQYFVREIVMRWAPIDGARVTVRAL